MKLRSPLGSTLIGLSVPKTNGSFGPGRLVSGTSPAERIRGETSNSVVFGLKVKSTFVAATGGCPSAANRPKDPLYLPGGSATDLSTARSLRVPWATSENEASSQNEWTSAPEPSLTTPPSFSGPPAAKAGLFAGR